MWVEIQEMDTIIQYSSLRTRRDSRDSETKAEYDSNSMVTSEAVREVVFYTF